MPARAEIHFLKGTLVVSEISGENNLKPKLMTMASEVSQAC